VIADTPRPIKAEPSQYTATSAKDQYPRSASGWNCAKDKLSANASRTVTSKIQLPKAIYQDVYIILRDAA